jgi:tetratricopeptide (TPR) repeat protein
MAESRRHEEASIVDYFALLGVPRDATEDEIEARYRAISDHLASSAIPAALRDWADREAALLDEAYAVLSDPERRAELEQSLSRPAAAVAAPVGAPVGAPALETDEDSYEEPVAPVRTARQEPVSAVQALLFGVPWKLMAVGSAIGIIVLVGVLLGTGALSGGDDDDGSQTAAEESEFPEIDEARVAELMGIVEQDPANQEATFELGETFFLGGEWQAAIDWFTKYLELDPDDVHALTDIGTSQFNLGNFEEAEAAWVKAKEIDPDDEQVHYNLGFLYANVEPVDYAAAVAEWQEVVRIAPDSDLASVAQVHMDSLSEEAQASLEASAAPTEATAAPTEEPSQ